VLLLKRALAKKTPEGININLAYAVVSNMSFGIHFYAYRFMATLIGFRA
jgi:hypothetical protein